ncbi:hypothetical protein LTR66_009883 [Elasticomyces elasticus]|nr:hypothetical protein LTR66_009883 [Elasticomyces elasticus]
MIAKEIPSGRDLRMAYAFACWFPPLSIALAGCSTGVVVASVFVTIFLTYLFAVPMAFICIHRQSRKRASVTGDMMELDSPGHSVPTVHTKTAIVKKIEPSETVLIDGPAAVVEGPAAIIERPVTVTTKFVEQPTPVKKELTREVPLVGGASTHVMWRLRPSNQRKDNVPIGRPTLIETTYDDQSLEDIHSATTLPALPFKSLLPVDTSRERRISSAPTASSAYSRTSAGLAHLRFDLSSATAASGDDVSPISSTTSPDNYPRCDGSHDEAVSPISDLGDQSNEQPQPAPERRRASQIPVLWKARSVSHKPSTPLTTSRTTRWDDFSGEPTTSSSGKPSQVKPSTYTPPITPAHDDPTYGVDFPVTDGAQRPKKATFAQRAAKFGSKALTVETRPPWKGARGRAALVSTSAPYDSPQSVTTPIRDQSPSWKMSTPNATPSVFVRPDSETSDQSQTETVSPISTIETSPIKPIVPLKLGKNSICSRNASPSSATAANTGYPSPLSPRVVNHSRQLSRASKITRKPVSSSSPASENIPPEPRRGSFDGADSSQTTRVEEVEQPQSRFSWTTYANSTADRRSAGTMKTLQTVAQQDATQPASRFSWTTQATNTTYQDRTPSATPPQPAHPPQWTMPAFTPTSSTLIIERRHPIGARNDVTPLPARTAPGLNPTTTPSPITTTTSPHPSKNTSPTTSPPPPPTTTTPPSTSSTTKALPLPPTLLQPTPLSHLDHLAAKLDDLNLQRRNTQRSIHQLEALQPSSPLLADLAARRELRRKVAELAQELADVKLRECEAGRRLARARRKEEREGGGSGLWVSRVVG